MSNQVSGDLEERVGWMIVTGVCVRERERENWPDLFLKVECGTDPIYMANQAILCSQKKSNQKCLSGSKARTSVDNRIGLS